MSCRLLQRGMTLSDLEWPFHAWRAISAVAELLALVRYEPSCLKYKMFDCLTK